MKTIDHFRRLAVDVEEAANYEKEKLPRWKNIASGPYWPVLRRYVRLLEICKEQAAYIEELTGIIEEMDESR